MSCLVSCIDHPSHTNWNKYRIYVIKATSHHFWWYHLNDDTIIQPTITITFSVQLLFTFYLALDWLEHPSNLTTWSNNIEHIQPEKIKNENKKEKRKHLLHIWYICYILPAVILYLWPSAFDHHVDNFFDHCSVIAFEMYLVV